MPTALPCAPRFQASIDKLLNPPGTDPNAGPTQCHDITVYPAIGLAGGACEGYGLLLDIHDPAHPVRLGSRRRFELLLLALGDLQQRWHEGALQ